MTNLSDILNRAVADTEKPKPMPNGTYLGMVRGQHEEVEIGANKTRAVKFTLQYLQPANDVDQQSLAEVLKGRPITDMTIKHTLYLTEDAEWRLRKFLEDLGFEFPKGSKMTYGQALANAPGKQLLFSIKHKPSSDGASIFANIDSTAPVVG